MNEPVYITSRTGIIGTIRKINTGYAYFPTNLEVLTREDLTKILKEIHDLEAAELLTTYGK